MYDDGNHEDGIAGDGVYGGTFYGTGQDGSYNVTIAALGYSPSLGENFYRSKVLSFHMARVDENGDEIFIPGTRIYPDTDNNGLPDSWEIFFFPWTDPNTSDAALDPDNDGSTNQQEWENGTDPGNPDTDGDGEADGTDDDPLDPTVGAPFEPPSAYAYPGVGEVFVRYTITPTYQYVGLFRDEDDDLDNMYAFIHQDVTPTLSGIYTDTAVINGTSTATSWQLSTQTESGPPSPPPPAPLPTTTRCRRTARCRSTAGRRAHPRRT